jgi:hypothetical protein
LNWYKTNPMNRICLTLFLLFISVSLIASEPPSIRPGDFDQLTITRQQEFNSSELWGLINGGADLYFEYGFDKLFLQEISIGKEQFRIEIYHMNDEVSAFGIYSVSVHKCDEMGKKVVNDCSNPYQYQMVLGNKYISVINYSGSDLAKKTSAEIADKLIEGVKKDGVYAGMAYYVKSKSGKEIITRIYKGILGIQNGNAHWLELFDGLEGFTLGEMSMRDEEGEYKIAAVECKNENQANLLKQRILDAEWILFPGAEDDNQLIFIDYSGYRGDIGKILQELEIEFGQPD